MPLLHAQNDGFHVPNDGVPAKNVGFHAKNDHFPRHSNWHRDWRDNIEGLSRANWWRHFHDDAYFNQVNCALYEDNCLWVVPGSHLRGDTPDEAARFPIRPVPLADLSAAQSDDERASLCIEYARSMPGAVNLVLKPGDFCIYRNTLWHMGCYRPDQIRATIHDGQMTPLFREFMKVNSKESAARREEGLGWATYEHEWVGSSPPRGEPSRL